MGEAECRGQVVGVAGMGRAGAWLAGVCRCSVPREGGGGGGLGWVMVVGVLRACARQCVPSSFIRRYAVTNVAYVAAGVAVQL